MAYYQPPVPLNQGKFNPAGYEDPAGALTIEEANSLFLRFPTAQGTENFGDANVVGTLTAGTFNPANITITGKLTTTNASQFATTFGYQTSEPTSVSNFHNTAYGYQCAKTLSATTGTGGNTAYGAIAMPNITGACNANTAIGHNALSSLTTGDQNTAVGCATVSTTITTGSDNTTIGFNAKGIGNTSYSVAVGSQATTTTSGVAVGYIATASGIGSVALGVNTLSIGTSSTALGSSSEARDDYSIAIGDATANNTGAIAIGNGTTTIGLRGVGIGYGAVASGETSVAIGDVATASGTDAIAIGDASVASATTSVAIGSASQAIASGSVAIGEGAQVSGTTSVAIGAGVVLSTSNTIQLGTSAETVRLRTLAPISDTTDLTIGSGSTGNITFNISATNPLRIGTTTQMVNFMSPQWTLAPVINTSYQAMTLNQVGFSRTYYYTPINFIPRYYSAMIQSGGTFTGTGVSVKFLVYKNASTSNKLGESSPTTITSGTDDIYGVFNTMVSSDDNNDAIYVALQLGYTTLTALNRTFYITFWGQQTP